MNQPNYKLVNAAAGLHFHYFYFPAKAAIGGVTVVDPSPHHPTVEGSSPTKSEREWKKEMLFYQCLPSKESSLSLDDE
jgi:hypothetical protein